MSVGLLALLDDVATLAKAAAVTLDDIAAQATKAGAKAAVTLDDITAQATRAGAKAAGVVIDDTAVTPRYVVGFAAERELPIVARIAAGSIRNKLLILLPALLILTSIAPWVLTPLLMIGGAYLCYEGVEKVLEILFPHVAHKHEANLPAVTPSARNFEDQKVAGAIKTDFILSAEIMAIALAAIAPETVWMRAAVLALVAIGITAGVYGLVALVVKADDIGLAMAKGGGRIGRPAGRLIIRAMPPFLSTLATVGTAAMIWVGGSLIVHGLDHFGITIVADAIHHAARAVAELTPVIAPIVEWIVTAAGYAIVGATTGAALIPLAHYVIAPLWKRLSSQE
jgi:predicted DNA repair protein MutK